MQNIRIYAAPSFSEVIKQLLIYRPTGVLTIWPATSRRQADTRITIELGRPIYVYRGLRWENATDSMMAWLNTWGEIHFSFQSKDARLRLPSPRAQQDSTTAQEMAIATLTAYGRAYSAAYLPRYDRTIFLLINGRRTVADLSQLTKRPQEDVFASIHRLGNLQLITIETGESR